MAHCTKYTKAACGNLFNHYERKDGIQFGNQEIDNSRSYLNYNLAPNRNLNLSQSEILENRLSEVKVLKRNDINVMCSWVITLPETITKEDEIQEFFKETYDFLENRYGKNNVISAYVHMDETTPHLHFSFVPVVLDKKKKIEKVSAKELISRKELKLFHQDFSEFMNFHFKRDIKVLNGRTINGNKTIEELKLKGLKDENNKLKAENLKIKSDIEFNNKMLDLQNESINEIKNFENKIKKINDFENKINSIKPVDIKIPFFQKIVSGINLKEIEMLRKKALKTVNLEKELLVEKKRYNIIAYENKKLSKDKENLKTKLKVAEKQSKSNLKEKLELNNIKLKNKYLEEFIKELKKEIPTEKTEKIEKEINKKTYKNKEKKEEKTLSI